MSSPRNPSAAAGAAANVAASVAASVRAKPLERSVSVFIFVPFVFFIAARPPPAGWIPHPREIPPPKLPLSLL
jgi:hypothetical protein